MVNNQTSKRKNRKRFLLPWAILIVAIPFAPFVPPSVVDGVMMALTVYAEG